VIQALPSNGPLPLQVNFNGTGSSDPNPGDTLTYAWDLDGDGAFDDSTSATPTFTYAVAKKTTVSLRVTDPLGAISTSSIVITAGDSPPTATILSPAPAFTWKVGDTINFSGSATDAKDGALPATALTWSLLMHHCPSSCHIHPIQDFVGVASGSFTGPDHEYPSHLELKLTATDSSGLTDTKSVLLNPKTVSLGLQSNPSGLQLVLGSGSDTTPFNKTVMIGSFNTVSAPLSQTVGPTTYQFGYWSTQEAQTHDLTAPETPATYTATYGEPLPAPWAHQDLGAVSDAGSAVQLGSTFAVTGTGADIFGSTDHFHFAYQLLSGDGEIRARVVERAEHEQLRQGGGMIRQSLTAQSPYAMMEILPNGQAAFQWRLTAAGTTTAAALPGPAPSGCAWFAPARRSRLSARSTEPAGPRSACRRRSTCRTTSTSDWRSLRTTTRRPVPPSSTTSPRPSGRRTRPPTAAITSPANGAGFSDPASIPIVATAADADGTVAAVAFYDGAALLGTLSAPPYTFNWSNPPAGAHSLTAPSDRQRRHHDDFRRQEHQRHDHGGGDDSECAVAAEDIGALGLAEARRRAPARSRSRGPARMSSA
jgi:hypothetical protein